MTEAATQETINQIEKLLVERSFGQQDVHDIMSLVYKLEVKAFQEGYTDAKDIYCKARKRQEVVNA